MHKYKIIFGAAILAAVSILLQIYKIAYPFAGIIDIDLVGVPWIVSTFLFGLAGGLITSVIGGFAISIVAPTAFVGGVMKFSATIIIVLIVGLVGKKFGFGKKPMIAAFIICLIARPTIMTLFNYYWAIPVFFKIPTETAIQQFPAWMLLVPNAILAISDFWIAYFLVFSTRLKARLAD